MPTYCAHRTHATTAKRRRYMRVLKESPEGFKIRLPDPVLWLESAVAGDFPWKSRENATLALFSPVRTLLSLVGLVPDFGEYVVDHDPPFDPAKAIMSSACKVDITNHGDSHCLIIPAEKWTLLGIKMEFLQYVFQALEIKHENPQEQTCPHRPRNTIHYTCISAVTSQLISL